MATAKEKLKETKKKITKPVVPKPKTAEKKPVKAY